MSGTHTRVQRRLAAILAADVVGYSRLMGQDEAGTLRTLMAHREIMVSIVAEHGGRIANTAGDSVLAEFPSAVDAVQSAIEVQAALKSANEPLASDRRVHFRIGVHVGDVILNDGDLFGEGVNIAARLQGIADPGGVCVSGSAHEYVRKVLPLIYRDLGLQQVKNIAEPVRVFAVSTGAEAVVETVRERDESILSQQSDRPSIAVLPFANFGGNSADAYFSDGVTEDLITALTRIRWFRVVSRNSVFGYRDRSPDPGTVSRELRARYLVEGSVRKIGNQLRLTAQLIEGETGRHLWAKRYDRELTDIFAVQDELTESIVSLLEPELGKAERERARSRTDNLTAWDLYQRGVWHLYRRHRDEVEQAHRLLSSALDLEPDLVPALCAAAEAHHFEVVFGYAQDPGRHRTQGMQLAKRAVELDDEDAAARCALARSFIAQGRTEDAIAHLLTAIRLNPSSGYTYYLLGLTCSCSGHAEQAVPNFETALKLSPHDPYTGRYLAALAEANLFMGQYEAAVHLAREALRHPALVHWSGHTSLISALGTLGRRDEGQVAVMDLLRLRPDFTIGLLKRSIMVTDPGYLARYIDGLRKAGLSE